MKYLSILKSSCVDFKGWSTVLQVSGCSNGCKGCFNPYSHNPKNGECFTEDVYQYLKDCLSKDYISNLVIQGGDPLYHKNIDNVITLCTRIKCELPNKNIVVFTGYTLSQIQADPLRSPILEVIDYLVDGKFEVENKVTGKFFGSSNQRIYNINSTENVVDVTDTF